MRSIFLCLLLGIFTLPLFSAHAYCAKCVKIEAEREEQKASQPPQSPYYEDRIKDDKETPSITE